jgi:hypothetical protein
LLPAGVCTTSRPRSPCKDTCSPPICPKRKTDVRGLSPKASASSFFSIADSIAARAAVSAPKKRSAGTSPSIP